MAAAAPPRPAPKPGRVRVYRALYDYDARTNVSQKAIAKEKLEKKYLLRHAVIGELTGQNLGARRLDQEMSFTEGDLLYVSDRGPNDDWLPATCGGRKGLVPANY
ncbi:SH3 domain protein, partial [Ancylostoma duodenale]